MLAEQGTTQKRDQDTGCDEASPLIPNLRLVFSAGYATPIKLLPLTEKTLDLGRLTLGSGVLSRRVSRKHATIRVESRTAVSIKAVAGDFLVNDQAYTAADGFIPLDAQDMVQLGDSLWVFELIPRDLQLGTDPKENSLAMRWAMQRISELAPSDCSVFIHGESGSGKERAARALHTKSGRKGEFVAINCAGLPPLLAEAELFGSKKGAFTGATDRIGVIAQADGGTLFLDEVGDLHPDMQAKLLRVLQEKKVRRLGANLERPVDVRFVSATHLSLEDLIAQGRFREDLFHRLVQAKVELPPLRQRRADNLALTTELWSQHWGEPMPEMTVEAAVAWTLYDWCLNNVRQLENAIRDPGLIRPADRPVQKITLAIARRALGLAKQPSPVIASGWPSTKQAVAVRKIFDEKGRVTSSVLAQALDLTVRRAQQILNQLEELRLIVCGGKEPNADRIYTKA